ncbi:uncharacterized protein LOC133889496 [Phragmites australis]|uniref:uncharacterized protein LOC133889496 n=1 Tax=Phragmites australis TaxID=29695 RepID=UPI002D767FD8|nr:uncharacterized protein LOC133889496 [Phragmites australis]XP_062185985.1 uncharacterized protein LOC133889496 [Phragmites australis]XP_062185991.1 uncharacterized protein LOC133889496 [Phragmites australis]
MTLTGASRRRRAPRPPLSLLVLVLLLLVSSPPPRASALRIPLRNLTTLVSLSHSLLSRVAATRAARGDAAAAARARRIASLISSRGAWGLGWDYLRHYAFSSATGCGLSCAAAASRLLAAAAEASRLRSTTDAAQWMRRHYGDVREAAAEILNGLLVAFSEQGPLREVVMDVKWEVEEGGLLKDCLEVGAKDLQGLLVIAKDLLAGASRASSRHSEL